MTSPAQRFLNQQDRQHIIEAVQEAERKTSGEIVPLVADMSDQYPAAEFNGAMVLGMLTAIASAWLLGLETIWLFLPVFCLTYVVFFLLVRTLPALKRFFVPGQVLNHAVSQAAINAFHVHGLHRTRDMTGILIYISVFEHKVHVLADKGINDRVPPQTWNEIVGIITDGIRRGEQGKAIAKAVTRCGELLSVNFPIRADDTDELPNLIVEGDENQ
ncbi:putative membrane protein [Paucidesulfovibrio gracilis DSM 16080]|uniref:Putative membrane protein n=1 Tax=Paucidesulfovibrio gracilis DSM 16080 TaxID=1121449 RepID=A0A1T4WJX0_9BACT|nr:TPM domain-containing protein [Paucidesulfovibrio gracilis]SKA76931.1 putative membrane protein [Paucidesulfovibrio gracilis DSM 16080]